MLKVDRLFVRRSLLLTISLLFLTIACAGKRNGILIAAEQARDLGDNKTAFANYQSYDEMHPGDKEVIAELDRLGVILTNEAAAEAEALLAKKDANVVELEELHASLKSSEQYDRKGRTIFGLMSRATSMIEGLKAKNTQSLSELHSAISGRQIQKAKELYSEIRRRNPQSVALNGLEPSFVEMYSTHISQVIGELLAAGQTEKAMAEVDSIRSLGLSEQGLSRLTSVFSTKLDEMLREQIKSDIASSRFYKAYTAILESGEKDKFSMELGIIRSRGPEFYLAKSKEFAKKDDVHRAYLEALKGYELSPEFSGLFEAHRDARDKVERGLQRYIAISAFGAPAKNPDLGPQFSDALISYLFRILPYGTKLLERQQIDLVMQEKKRELKTVSDLLNVDLIVSGNVSLMEIDRQESFSNMTVRAQVGTTEHLNPSYTEWQEDPEGQAPPKTILVPHFENVKYRKGRVTVKGFSTVSVRIFDAQKGSITYAQEFNAKYNVTDEFNDEVVGANIDEDPLTLPSDTEIHEILRDNIVGQLAEVLQKEFAERKERFVDEAHRLIARKEVDKAVRPLAEGFVYFIKSKTDPKDPHVRAVRDLIIKHTEDGR